MLLFSGTDVIPGVTLEQPVLQQAFKNPQVSLQEGKDWLWAPSEEQCGLQFIDLPLERARGSWGGGGRVVRRPGCWLRLCPCTFPRVTLLPAERGESGWGVSGKDLPFCIHTAHSTSGSCPPTPLSAATRKLSVQCLELPGSVCGCCGGEG